MRVIVIIFLVYVFLQSVLAAAFFPTLFALWLSALIVVPPALVALGYAVFLRRAGRIAPRRLLQRLTNELDPHSPIEASGATSFSELFSAAFGERPSGSTFRWRALQAYALSVVVLTLIWALAWPNDAARLLYGITSFDNLPIDPPLMLGRAVGGFLASAVVYFPPFYVSLLLAHRALVPRRTHDPRLVLRRVLAAAVGTVLAVLASNAIFLGVITLIIQQEYRIVGALKGLPYQLLLRSGYGYISDGIFVYACFFALAWFALHIGARTFARRMLRFQNLAKRLWDRPLHAIGIAIFVVAFGANLSLFVTRAVLTDFWPSPIPDDAGGRSGVTFTRVVDQFDLFVFGPNGNRTIEKYEAPLIIEVAGDLEVAAHHEGTLRNNIADLERLTGFPVRLASDSREAPNFSLIFAERKAFNRIYLNESVGLQAGPIEFALCIASAGRVFIGSDNDASVIDNCLPHELMHAFGFYYHACYYRPSALCLLDRYTKTYSEGDSLLLATLYDPQIRNGMGREEALPIARTILRELMGSRALPSTQ